MILRGAHCAIVILLHHLHQLLELLREGLIRAEPPRELRLRQIGEQRREAEDAKGHEEGREQLAASAVWRHVAVPNGDVGDDGEVDLVNPAPAIPAAAAHTHTSAMRAHASP